VLVETRLIDQSGEWLATTVKLPSGEVAPQKVGSLVSYLRRYALLAMVGVAAEDDDGKEAQQAAPPKRTAPPAPPKTQPATAKPVAAPKPVPATPPAEERVEPRVIADPVREDGVRISAKDRGLLFKVAKEQGLNETQVKQLIFALWGYTSTGAILQGAQFGKLLSAMENPQDHGVTIGNGDLTYDRAQDANPLPGNPDLGGL
jgi:hypothetical protein